MRKRKGFWVNEPTEPKSDFFEPDLETGGETPAAAAAAACSLLSLAEVLLAEEANFLAAKAWAGVSYFLGLPLFLLTGSIETFTAEDGTEKREEEDPSLGNGRLPLLEEGIEFPAELVVDGAAETVVGLWWWKGL